MILRRLVLAASVGLSGCGSIGPAAPAAPSLGAPRAIAQNDNAAKAPGHLYVAGSGNVERFRIVNGKPMSPPDLTYSGVGAPIAIAPTTHALYATALSSTSVVVFPEGSNKPIRTLDISPPQGYSGGPISSLLVDSENQLLVGYQYEYRYHVFVVHYFVIYAYKPRARGDAKPLSVTEVTDCTIWCTGALAGLALDTRGQLFVAFWDSVKIGGRQRTYSAVFGNRQPLTSVVFANGLAASEYGELYVDNPTDPPYNSQRSFISAYPVYASGGQPPDRRMTVHGARFGGGIALSPLNLLYVPDPIHNVVYELHAKRNGEQKPVSTLAVSSPYDVKLGP